MSWYYWILSIWIVLSFLTSVWLGLNERFTGETPSDDELYVFVGLAPLLIIMLIGIGIAKIPYKLARGWK